MDLDRLRAAVWGGRSFAYLPFWGHTPRGSRLGRECFSQWYPAAFVVDGQRYATAEHFMMAEKARLFGDEEAWSRIVAARSPGSAKALGRGVQGFDDSVWEAHRSDIVVRGNVAKFSQDERLRDFLLATGDKVLVEASPRDRIWGIGIGPDDPRVHDPAQWRGLNLLGFALMAARDALRAAG